MNRGIFEKMKQRADFVRHHLDDRLIGLAANEKDLQLHLIDDEELRYAAVWWPVFRDVGAYWGTGRGHL
jgi:hypothetical protein